MDCIVLRQVKPTPKPARVLVNVALWVIVGVLAVAIGKRVADKLSSVPAWSRRLDAGGTDERAER